MKIAYSGTYGTGKTYSTYMKAVELKKENPEKEVGSLVNVERECPLPINKNTTFESQMWIFARKVQEEIRLANIYDFLVCDCTVMDVVAYTWLAKGNNSSPDEDVQRMLNLAHAWVRTYDRILWKSSRNNDWHNLDGTRELDPDFRLQVEGKIRELYCRENHILEIE